MIDQSQDSWNNIGRMNNRSIMNKKLKTKVFDTMMYQILTSLTNECEECRVILNCTCDEIKKACSCTITINGQEQAEVKEFPKIAS